MKKRFIEKQIIKVLDKVNSGMKVEEVCRKRRVVVLLLITTEKPNMRVYASIEKNL